MISCFRKIFRITGPLRVYSTGGFPSQKTVMKYFDYFGVNLNRLWHSQIARDLTRHDSHVMSRNENHVRKYYGIHFVVPSALEVSAWCNHRCLLFYLSPSLRYSSWCRPTTGHRLSVTRMSRESRWDWVSVVYLSRLFHSLFAHHFTNHRCLQGTVSGTELQPVKWFHDAVHLT